MFLFVSTYLVCPYPFIPPTSQYSSYISVSNPSFLYSSYSSCIPVFLLCPFCIPIFNHSSLYYSIYLYPRIPPVSLYPSCIPVSNPSSLYSSVYLYPLYPFVSLLYPCISLVSLYPILHPCIPLSTCTPLYPSCIPVSNLSSLY